MKKIFTTCVGLFLAATMITACSSNNSIKGNSGGASNNTPAPAGNDNADKTEKSLAELAKKHGFKLGGAIGAKQMADANYKTMLTSDFNSLTATNEMKAYSLLDQTASQNNPDGMPVMRYDMADVIVKFAQDNKIAVRGHTLVWDAYMNDWFFRVGYNSANDYVDKETMKKRLKYYIEQVVSHFEKKFPGVVYCWDVVNEAVGDGSADYAAGDPRHIRKLRNGQNNPFYDHIGEDYAELSFLYAKDAVDKLKAENPAVDIKLFYNDYNTFYDEKRDTIFALVQSINSYAKDAKGNIRKLCDGVGMQGYIGGYGQQAGCMNPGDLIKIETAIKKYATLGVEVHVTEMAVRNYQSDEDTVKKHADFYAELFKVFARVNSGEKKPLTCVAIWGLTDNPNMKQDDYSYKMNGPFCGLFDENYKEKSAFAKVYEVLDK